VKITRRPSGSRAARSATRVQSSARCINRLKQWRRVATRYDKRDVNYLAMVTIAAIMVWLN